MAESDDLDFKDAGQFFPAQQVTWNLREMSDVAIRRAANVFCDNVERIRMLFDLAPACAALSSHGQRADASFRAGVVAGGESHIAAIAEHQNQMKRMSAPAFLDLATSEDGYREVSRWAKQHPPVREGVKALLSSMLIGAWTAFEVLAEDLWVQCVNARPRLAFFAINAEPKAEDDEEEKKRKKKLKFQLPVDLFRDPNFDVRVSMGTALREK